MLHRAACQDYFQGSQSISIPGRTFPVTSYYLEHALLPGRAEGKDHCHYWLLSLPLLLLA